MSEQKESKEQDHRYPRWKHHPEKGAIVVKSAAEEKKLGKGWCESPAEFEKSKSDSE